MVLTTPVFQSRSIPIQVKIIISFALALVIAPFIKIKPELLDNFLLTVFMLIAEVLIGLIIGFTVSMTIYAVQLAGYFFDISLGFGVVNILDPTTGTEMPLLGYLNQLVALTIFLAINAHHMVIVSLIKSYSVIPPGLFSPKPATAGFMLGLFANMFLLGFQIGLPIMGAIFLTDVALGIISKLLPQINVFMVGFPVKILLGLTMLILFLPVYIFILEAVFANSGDTFRAVQTLLKLLRN